MRFKESMKFIFIFLLFFTPLVFTTNTNELYEFPKMFFVYIVGLFIITLFVLRLLLGKKLQLSLPPKVVYLFLLSFVISTIFSSQLYTSVWGYYTRFNGGLISVLVGFGIYFVAKNWFDNKTLTTILDFVLINIIPISIYGIYQSFSTGVARTYSTFGQPDWLAQYLVMTLPLCLLTFVSEGNWLFGVVYLLGFTCLWLTFSLAGLLGFVAALIVVVAVLFVQKKLSRRVVAKLAGAMLLSLVVGVLNLGIFKDRIYDSVVDLKKVVRSQTVVYAQEVQDGDHKISDPGFIREGLWQGTWHLITSSPKVLLIGTGPETFPYAFQPYRPLVLNYSSEWNFVFNKPHNYYLELWAEKGLLGLGSYIALLYFLFRKLPKNYLPGLVGFVVTNFFGWPCVATALLFWLWFALAEDSHAKS